MKRLLIIGIIAAIILGTAEPTHKAEARPIQKQTQPTFIYLGEFEATHYAPTGNLTRTETVPEVGKTIAVDPDVIPLGSLVYVENYGFLRAEDTGGKIKKNRLDVFVSSEEEAIKLGRIKNLKVWLVIKNK